MLLLYRKNRDTKKCWISLFHSYQISALNGCLSVCRAHFYENNFMNVSVILKYGKEWFFFKWEPLFSAFSMFIVFSLFLQYAETKFGINLNMSATTTLPDTKNMQSKRTCRWWCPQPTCGWNEKELKPT